MSAAPIQDSPSDTRLNLSAGLASVTVALVLVLLKLWALAQTGALSIAATLVDSALDLLMSAGGLAAIFYAAKPADEDHAFGHSSAEDIAALAECFPGAVVTGVEGDSFSGTVKVKLGPIALQYAGSGTFVQKDDAAHRFVVEAKGKDKRGNGTAGATVTVQLSDAGDGNTRADVQTDLNITGKPAQFGRGVMQDVSDKLLNQFVACIEGKVGTPAAPEASDEAAAAPAGEAEPRPVAGADSTDAAPTAAPGSRRTPGAPPARHAPEDHAAAG